MSDIYKPENGDRVRVVYEGVVGDADTLGFLIREKGKDTVPFLFADAGLVSVKKIEPDPVLPDGLTISEDGNLLNWQGENYTRQPVDEPAKVFKPGDVVRQVTDHYFANSEFGNGSTYKESPFGIGSIGRVRAHRYASRGPLEHVSVRWEGGKRTSVIATRSLELVDLG